MVSGQGESVQQKNGCCSAAGSCGAGVPTGGAHENHSWTILQKLEPLTLSPASAPGLGPCEFLESSTVTVTCMLS